MQGIQTTDDDSLCLSAGLELAVVLIEPRIPQNTGNITRLCACTGADLYLVGSLGFRLDDKYLDRAGMDYKAQVNLKHVPDFRNVLEERPGWDVCFLSTKAKQSYTQKRYAPGTLLVFGPETSGLPEWVMMDYPESSVRIPMLPGRRSLNLSSAVSVVVYEAVRQMTSETISL